MDTPPQLALMIATFNDAGAATHGQAPDMIGDCIRSVFATLAGDPTRVEIVIWDDGSTDDTALRIRLALDEVEPLSTVTVKVVHDGHRGRLSATSNAMVRETSAQLLVRLDADTVLLTNGWASLLCLHFETRPDFGIIGPQQLDPYGKVHAFGDAIIHPLGYHHLYSGYPPLPVNEFCEVDHTMGAMYAMRRSVWASMYGFDETIGRGEAIDMSIAARVCGARVGVTSDIRFVHRHCWRCPRTSQMDAGEDIARSRQVMRDKWGFDWHRADLREVWRRYRHTKLCWNADVFQGITT